MDSRTFFLVAIATISCFTLGCGNSSSNNSRRCVDVTSYDYNRNNDMKCTSSKGEVKYTSYEGARVLMGK